MIGTYTELLAAIANWLNRADLTSRIPEFVQLAEARFNRTIWTPECEATSSLSAANPTSLPADFRALRNLYISTSPKTPLEQVSPSYLQTYYGASTGGLPVVYALLDDKISFGPAAASGYTVVLDYYQAIPALVSNATNWLLTSHPDLYLYATLVQSEAFTWNDERLGIWKAGLDEALAELEGSGNKRRWGGGPLIRKGMSFS